MHETAPHNLPIDDTQDVLFSHRFVARSDDARAASVSAPAHAIRQRPPVLVFLAMTVVVFFCTLSVLDSIGFVPDYIDGTTPSDNTPSTQTPTDDAPTELAGVTFASGNGSISIPKTIATSTHTTATEPVRIIIASQSIDLPVQNPATTNVDSLDALLINGPAHYSASNKLGENGNIVIFAHSSHLPIVHNQMFRAFNKIPDLNAGDIITLVGANGEHYNYAVDSVKKATTDDGTTIELGSSQQLLTLVTCDTLTGKSARFVLTAHFVGSE